MRREAAREASRDYQDDYDYAETYQFVDGKALSIELYQDLPKRKYNCDVQQTGDADVMLAYVAGEGAEQLDDDEYIEDVFN